VQKNEIIERLSLLVGEENIRVDEPMKSHTSFKVGGPADIFVTPVNTLQVRDVLKLCHDAGYPVFIMGNGTNLVVRDGGIRGVVLKIYDNFNKIHVEDNMITADGGALLSVISRTALRESLKGLEFASGIPGTAGGAVYMNAGAYNGEIKDVVHSADVIDDKFNIITLNRDELKLDYRKSIVSANGYVVVRVRFQLEKGEYSEIKDRIDLLTRKRKEKQPLHLPSAGSTFKRPEGYFTGKLIEDCLLKGYKIGGAEVSTKHAGFIINSGEATAKDVLDLICHVQNTVKEKYNVELHPEVRIIGEEAK
jgi:UDP-N-acetylmuramate dehydrogenase